MAGGAWLFFTRREAPAPAMSRGDKENWRMPGLALLERPPMSLARRIAMLTLSGYLVLAIVMLAIKAGQLALGHR